MTDGIGRIFGGNNYGIGGYGQPKRNEEAQQNANEQVPTNNYNDTQLDPAKIMDFMANNNYFVAPAKDVASPVAVDAATQDRVEGYMENFEVIYDVISREFGEELAPMVFDFCMDYLIDMAA